MEKRIKSFDGTRINYDISKVNKIGAYLIFLHGVGGNLTAWRKEIYFFHKKGICTVAIDLRGHGKSDRPKLVEDYSLENFALDVHEVIKHEKIRNFIIIGHCFGGVVTITFHKLFPALAKSYIFIDTTYKAPKKLKGFFKNHIFFKHIINYILEHEDLRKIHFSHADYKKFVDTADYDASRIFSDITHTSFKSWIFTYENLANFDGVNILKNIKKNVLVIGGKEDTIFNVLKAKRIHNLIKGSRLEIIPKANHILVLNNPKAIEEKIYNFIKLYKEFH